MQNCNKIQNSHYNLKKTAETNFLFIRCSKTRSGDMQFVFDGKVFQES